jgi:hypothetical protein
MGMALVVGNRLHEYWTALALIVGCLWFTYGTFRDKP